MELELFFKSVIELSELYQRVFHLFFFVEHRNQASGFKAAISTGKNINYFINHWCKMRHLFFTFFIFLLLILYWFWCCKYFYLIQTQFLSNSTVLINPADYHLKCIRLSYKIVFCFSKGIFAFWYLVLLT